jgi:hypothetical protein
MEANIEFIPNPDFPDEFANMIKKAALAQAKEYLEQIHGGETPIQISADELEAKAKQIAINMQEEFQKIER